MYKGLAKQKNFLHCAVSVDVYTEKLIKNLNHL